MTINQAYDMSEDGKCYEKNKMRKGIKEYRGLLHICTSALRMFSVYTYVHLCLFLLKKVRRIS